MSDPTLHALLGRLGFRIDQASLDALLKETARARRGPREVIERLCELERRTRDTLHMERRQRQAKLGTFLALDQFNWSHPQRVDRERYEDLLSMEFVARSTNVLFRGSVGLGKTTLAKNLGFRALQHGLTVGFTTLSSMIAEVARPQLPQLQARRLRRYTRPDVLIIDEIGYLPFDARAADVFYTVIDERHERRSTIVTTNLPFKAWAGIFADAASVVALVDRFSENLVVIDIEGETARGQRSRVAENASQRRPARSRRR
jgi:DNA replication protein DnaC